MDLLQIPAELREEPNEDVEPASPFIYLAYHHPTDGGFHRLLDRFHVHPVPGKSSPIQANDQVVLPREPLCLHVYGALDLGQHPFDILGELLERGELLAIDPHGQLSPGTREELVQVVGDGLG